MQPTEIFLRFEYRSRQFIGDVEVSDVRCGQRGRQLECDQIASRNPRFIVFIDVSVAVDGDNAFLNRCAGDFDPGSGVVAVFYALYRSKILKVIIRGRTQDLAFYFYFVGYFVALYDMAVFISSVRVQNRRSVGESAFGRTFAGLFKASSGIRVDTATEKFTLVFSDYDIDGLG